MAPRAFIDKLKELNELFRSTMHQDAHEFLNFLLNRIVEEIEEDRKQAQNGVNGDDSGSFYLKGRLSSDDYLCKVSGSIATLATPTVITTSTSSNSGVRHADATLVHSLFEGVLTSETRCLTCETVSCLHNRCFWLPLIFLHRHLPVTNLSWTCPLTSSKIPV